MDTVQIVCDGCGARLKAPASLPAGKVVKCPGCGGPITIKASDPKPAPAPKPTAIVPAPSKAVVPVVEAVETKDCPFCGETIKSNAAKCKHCGEFLEEDRKLVKKQKKRKAASADMNGAEYFVGTVLFPVGLVVGGVWAAQGLRKAGEMLKTSILSLVIVGAGGLLYHQYNKTSAVDASLPSVHANAGPASDSLPSRRMDELSEDLEDALRRRATQPRPEMTAPSPADVAKQPAPIQRALRSTVVVLSAKGVGTGVILQREGGKAFIITNRHVVDDGYAGSRGQDPTPADKIPPVHIKFITGDEKEGKVKWVADGETDLALVEVDAPSNVEVAKWDKPADVHIGDQVFAVGNPAGLAWTTTFGKVSAFRDHNYGSDRVAVVQTDTRIGPGNSGGGLFTQEGILVGINTFVVASSRINAGETGLGFAVRIELLQKLRPAGLAIPKEDAKKADEKKADDDEF
jgi:S1-C subfamily serine protease/DNA-directed RNA polymerase subunit RPC12/RpoP